MVFIGLFGSGLISFFFPIMYLKVVNPMIRSYFLLISIIVEKGLDLCLLLIGFVTLAKKNSQNVLEKISYCSRTRPRGA